MMSPDGPPRGLKFTAGGQPGLQRGLGFLMEPERKAFLSKRYQNFQRVQLYHVAGRIEA